MPKGKSTLIAFMRLGLDMALAQRLVSQDVTVGRAQQMSDSVLAGHGFTAAQIKLLRGKDRPPIPPVIVEQLLSESAYSCSICLGADVVIHHIVEWEISHDHSEPNLVVLCLSHHNEAHTRRDHTLTLSAERLRALKQRHVDAVRTQRATAALAPDPLVSSFHLEAFWDYFNTRRLWECVAPLVSQGALTGTLLDSYRELAKLRILSIAGGVQLPRDLQAKKYFFINPFESDRLIYKFFDGILRLLLSKPSFIDLTEDARWSRRFVTRHVRDQSLIVCKGRFSFKSGGTLALGPGQNRSVRLRRKGIQLEFTIDAWEALSNSAYTLHLTGTQLVTAVCYVRSVSHDEGLVVIRATCLAIGTGFGPTLPDRTPAIAYQRQAMYDGLEPDEEDEQSDPELPD